MSAEFMAPSEQRYYFGRLKTISCLHCGAVVADTELHARHHYAEPDHGKGSDGIYSPLGSGNAWETVILATVNGHVRRLM